jgi:hypothetical protein
MRTRYIVALPLFATLALAACGGGGSTGSTLPPVQPPVTAQPTPTPTPTPMLAGRVVQLAGPLAANGAPNAQSTPAAGAAIAGATVYVTAATDAALTSPQTSPLAVATTAPDGSWQVPAPTNTSGPFGVVVIDGTSIGANGVTNLGYTVAHGLTLPGDNGTYYLDTLTANEQSGFTAYNAARASSNMPLAVSDTTAQMTARVLLQTDVASQTCSATADAYTSYRTFGGALIANEQVIGDESNTPYYNSWSTQITFPQEVNLDFAGFAGPYIGGPICPGSTLPQNYFAEVLIAG